MSQINLKSISGITSITTPAGVDNVFTVHSNDTTERFRVDQSGNQNISGIVTATTFSGSGASLTNLNGSNIASGTVPVARIGTGTKNTSTFYRGDGTFATVTSTTINNNAANKVIMGSNTANTLEAVAKSTLFGNLSHGQNFLDDQNLVFGDASDMILIHQASGAKSRIRNTNDSGSLDIESTLTRFTNKDGSTEKLRIDSSGNLIVNVNTAAAGGYTYKLLTSDNISSSEQTFGIQYPAVVTYGLNAESNADFTIKKDGAERLRITSAGRVGIDRTSPLTMLDIKVPPLNTATITTTNCLTLGMLLTSGGTGSNTEGHIYNGLAVGDGYAGLYGKDGGSSAATDLEFFTGTSSAVAGRVRIQDDGKIIIGGNVSQSINRNVSIVAPTGNSQDIVIGLQPTNSSGGYNPEVYIGATADGTYGAAMYFYTRDTSGNRAERVRIFSNGSVGVGNYSSTNLTHAFQALRTSGSTYVSSKNTGGSAVFYAEASGGNTAKLELMQAGVGNFTLEVGGTNALMFKDDGTEKLRINSGSVWINGSAMPTSSSGARLQVGAHTFTGSNHVYHTSRLGIQNNGSLTCISNCSTYTDVTYPGYGFVMVQGASTSDYNTFGICPDSPQTGSDLNFHSGYKKSNIHSDSGVRQMWINMSGQVYKRDNGANWNQTSDERLKKNIVDNNIGLAEIKQLRITSFEYRKADEIDMSLFPKANDPLQVIIEGEEGPHTGVIAQEIESVLPECVKTSDKGAKTVQADAITWALVNAVKELSAKNDALEERIKKLEGS